MSDLYSRLTLRNIDYINGDLQGRIRETRILVAGCGIGSYIAETLIRVGFTHITLVDHDTIETHNLNRQSFTQQDVDKHKVKCLEARLLSINPEAEIMALVEPVSKDNVEALVKNNDIIVDSIDFLDLSAIVALHDTCKAKGRDIISAMNVGFGAGMIYFPAKGHYTIREVFNLPSSGSVDHLCYAEVLKKVVDKIGNGLNPDVVRAVNKIFDLMQHGTPCPASQVAPGVMAVGSIVTSALVKILAGETVTPAPSMIVVDMMKVLESEGVSLL